MIIYTAANGEQFRSIMTAAGLRLFDVPEIDEASHLPLSPREIITRVEGWVLDGFQFATMSEIAILTVCRMVKQGRIRPYHVLFRAHDGSDHRVNIAIDGDFIEPWPQANGESVFDAHFHLRYQ